MDFSLPKEIVRALGAFKGDGLKKAEERILLKANRLASSGCLNVSEAADLLVSCLAFLWILDFRGNRLGMLILKAVRRVARES